MLCYGVRAVLSFDDFADCQLVNLVTCLCTSLNRHFDIPKIVEADNSQVIYTADEDCSANAFVVQAFVMSTGGIEEFLISVFNKA